MSEILFSDNIESRKIYLGDDISPATTAELFRVLDLLEQDNADAPATMFINSVGGDTIQGLAMYDLIRNAPFKITGIVIGECASSAVMPFQACAVRKMLPNARLMMHDGRLELPETGYAEALKMVQEMQDNTRAMYEVLSRHSNKSHDELARVLKDSTYFSVNQAIEAGFCDKVHLSFL